MNRHKKLEIILNDLPQTRNDDKLMYIEFLKRYYCENDFEKSVIEKILSKAPNQASLVRARAYIQNELGMYLPTIDIQIKRKKMQEKVKSMYSSKKL